MQKTTRIIDLIMRIFYLAIYFGAGITALFFVGVYSDSMTISFLEPQGRGEMQVLGAFYITTAAVFLYQWIKGQVATIYINPALVISATLVSRLVSVLKGDVNQALVILIVFEIVLALWAFWGLSRYRAKVV